MNKKSKHKQKYNDGEIPLRVQFFATNEVFYLPSVSKHATIHDLKCQIELQSGIPFELQELSYLDAGYLPNEQSISNVDIVQNGMITLQVWHTWKDLVKACCTNDIEKVFLLGVTQDSEYQTATSDYMLPKQRKDWLQHRCAVALFIACHRSNFEMARRLLQVGANVNAVTVAGRTPLHVAAAKNNIEIIDLLLEKGADTDQADNEDSPGGARTPLEIAAQCGHKVCERRLFMHRWEKRAYSKKPASGATQYGTDDELFEFQRSDSSNPRWRVGPQAQVYLEATTAANKGKKKPELSAGDASGPSSAGGDKKHPAMSFEQWQEQKRQERAKQLLLMRQRNEQLENQSTGKKSLSSAQRGVIDDQLLSQFVASQQAEAEQQMMLERETPREHASRPPKPQRPTRRLDPQLNAYEQWLKDRVDSGADKAVSAADGNPHELLPYQLMIEEFCRARCFSHDHHDHHDH